MSAFEKVTCAMCGKSLVDREPHNCEVDTVKKRVRDLEDAVASMAEYIVACNELITLLVECLEYLDKKRSDKPCLN